MTERALKTSQADFVRSGIEARISQGLLVPGQRIEEVEIAEIFGTSRTPVREAVSQLVAAGLLHKTPRLGAVVPRLDLRQTLDLMDFSAELAASSARFAARRLRPDELETLRDLCAQLEDHLLANDVAGYAATASSFHATIIAASRNSYLIEALERSVIHLARYFRYCLTYPGQMRADLDDHHRLIDAFEARDGETARMLMRRHALIDPDIIGDYIADLEQDDSR